MVLAKEAFLFIFTSNTKKFSYNSFLKRHKMSKRDELLKLFINYCIVAFLGIFSYIFVNFDEMNFLKIMLSSVGLLACVTSLILLSRIYIKE